MPENPPALRWQSMACLLLSILGLIGSIYLTISHFDTRFFVCPVRGQCERILTSNSSHFLGIPVPILGIAYFLPMTVLCLPVAWRAVDKRVHLVRLLLAIVGIAMVIYLFAEELFVLQSLCVWCSIIHAIGFALFVIIVTTSPVLLGDTSRAVVADAD